MPDPLELLTELDFFEDPLTIRVWLAAVDRGDFSAADLILAKEDHEEVLARITWLTDAGFLEDLGDARLRVRPPVFALEGHAANLESRAQLARAVCANMNHIYEASAQIHSTVDAADGIELLPTLTSINEAMAHLYAFADKKVISMRRKTPRVLHMLTLPPTDHVRWARNLAGEPVQVEATFHPELLANCALRDRIEVLEPQGESFRFSNRVPFTASVSDTGTAVLDIRSYDDQSLGVRITHPAAVRMIREMVEAVWADAIPWRGNIEKLSEPDLDVRDREILTMLASGAPDSVVSRSLNISQRTVERRIRRVMDLLGADSRFQAGVLASRRGWV